MLCRLLAATLAAVTIVPASQSLQASGGPESDRKVSTVVLAKEGSPVVAAASVSYSSPDWKDGHDAMLDSLKGGLYTRLGKGWWTTFDSIGALELGGTRIDAGSYYLGLVVDKDGAFRLLLFDAGQVMKAGLLPGSTPLYRGELEAQFKAPLTFARNSRKEVVVKLEIEITADPSEPASGRFAIRWGRHELSAPVKFHLAGAKDAAAPKK